MVVVVVVESDGGVVVAERECEGFGKKWFED